MKQGILESGKMITGETQTVIELTQGRKVLVQGMIGRMAATKEWYYDAKRKTIYRNIIVDEKTKSKQSLIRFLLSLERGDGIRATRINTNLIISKTGEHLCENYLFNNLKTNRKINGEN